MKFLLFTNTWPGHWGKADTISEALKNAKWINPGTEVTVLVTDDNAFVNEMGHLMATEDLILGSGVVRKNYISMKLGEN
jgi:hypothetical protein